MVHVIHATTNHCNEMYVSLHREVTKSFVASQASAVLLVLQAGNNIHALAGRGALFGQVQPANYSCKGLRCC